MGAEVGRKVRGPGSHRKYEEYLDSSRCSFVRVTVVNDAEAPKGVLPWFNYRLSKGGFIDSLFKFPHI